MPNASQRPLFHEGVHYRQIDTGFGYKRVKRGTLALLCMYKTTQAGCWP